MATAKRTRTAKSSKATKAVPAPQVAKVTTQPIDIQQAIRTRAYQFYQDRGCTHGHDLEDWLRAEEEVLSHRL